MSAVCRICVTFVKQRLRDMQNKLIVIVGDGHEICDWMLCFAARKFGKIYLDLKNQRGAFLQHGIHIVSENAHDQSAFQKNICFSIKT